MNCWHCGTHLEEAPEKRLPFRAICDKCTAWLHCCKNCKNYKPGLPNDCAVPGTEYIADREACNFCEEFVLKGEKPAQQANPDDVARRLFGESSKRPQKPSSKNNFDNLFND